MRQNISFLNQYKLNYKIHKYNKITIYTQLALQTIKISMYTETVLN